MNSGSPLDFGLAQSRADHRRALRLAETAIALGNLRRRGMAVAAVLVRMDDDGLERAYGRLVAEGIRDLRHCPSEEALPDLCSHSVNRTAPYGFA